jgi:hypothetical protein
MVSPNLIRKTSDSSLTLSPDTKKLFQLIYSRQKKTDVFADDDIPRIHVSHIVSRLSFFYEQVRQAVDYDEDHLLRKNAIKRILKRQLIIEGSVIDYKNEEIAKHLLIELIQGGYLPNNKIPESKIPEVSVLLEKYIKLRHYFRSSYQGTAKEKGNVEKINKERNRLTNWIITLAATEIEQNLNQDEIKKMAMANMFDILARVIKLPAGSSYQKDLNLQIYLSLARNYLKQDADMLSFLAFKFYNTWENIGDAEIKEIATHLDKINLAVTKQLDHPLIKQMDKVVRRYSLYFLMLIEVIQENPTKTYEQAVGNLRNFTATLREKCEKKYIKVKSKLWRSGLRSIIYIFLTKSIFVFILEIPAIKFFGEPVNITSLAINITFPAFLLFVMILFTRVPNNKNTDKIIEGIKEISFVENKKTQPIVLKPPSRRGYIMDGFFNILYSGAFLVAIYFLIILLNRIHFTWVSITIFLFFLSFVSFFSFRIKKEVKQYIITEERETLLGFLFNFFYMPIVAMGRFLSNNVSKINIFIFIFDFIIETPFKIMVAIIEDWTKYLKERKEDLA